MKAVEPEVAAVTVDIVNVKVVVDETVTLLAAVVETRGLTKEPRKVADQYICMQQLYIATFKYFVRN